MCFIRLYILIEMEKSLDNKNSVDEDVVQFECNLHVWNMWVKLVRNVPLQSKRRYDADDLCFSYDILILEKDVKLRFTFDQPLLGIVRVLFAWTKEVLIF